MLLFFSLFSFFSPCFLLVFVMIFCSWLRTFLSQIRGLRSTLEVQLQEQMHGNRTLRLRLPRDRQVWHKEVKIQVYESKTQSHNSVMLQIEIKHSNVTEKASWVWLTEVYWKSRQNSGISSAHQASQSSKTKRVSGKWFYNFSFFLCCFSASQPGGSRVNCLKLCLQSPFPPVHY